MSRLATQCAQAFRRAWRAFGEPEMMVVAPVSTWALPPGYAYDPAIDALRDAQGQVVADPSAYWTASEVPVVPQASEQLQQLMAAGLLPAGSAEVLIRPADAEAVRHAHRVRLDGHWYTVEGVSPAPLGAETAWAAARLTRRK